jgi:hypothetical protein
MTAERKYNLAIWEGDGLPEYDEWRDMVLAFDLTDPELEGWLEACKTEAWVRERMARHTEGEERDWTLAVCRYYWRRVSTLTDYIKRHNSQTDEEIEDDDET